MCADLCRHACVDMCIDRYDRDVSDLMTDLFVASSCCKLLRALRYNIHAFSCALVRARFHACACVASAFACSGMRTCRSTFVDYSAMAYIIMASIVGPMYLWPKYLWSIHADPPLGPVARGHTTGRWTPAMPPAASFRAAWDATRLLLSH